MGSSTFFDRDISWLSFNERVLSEAERETVPLFERIKFMSIYSSNLDEFYRVRMPILRALQQIDNEESAVYEQATDIIKKQQNRFGKLLQENILPDLKKNSLFLIYNEEIPNELGAVVSDYFFTRVAAFLHLTPILKDTNFFPENNQLYLAVIVQLQEQGEEIFLINVPTDDISRFLKITRPEGDYIIFLEDIIQFNLNHLFPKAIISGVYNIKITRDAALDIRDEYENNLVEKIEELLVKREQGFATRLLYQPGISFRHLYSIIQYLNLQEASVLEGGGHHNLKDLALLPLRNPELSYPEWPTTDSMKSVNADKLLFQTISRHDIIVHTPYQSYDTILRFFNEAAIDNNTDEIYATLYRVASDSKIVHALISAALNGKKVSVLVELKARFDEANNVRWAKRMKAAGIKILYSNNKLKVHAKIALVKRKHTHLPYLGLLATGNLNENTARFYTDHILLTAYQPILEEIHALFNFLRKKEKLENASEIHFQHILVAQFNLQSKFLQLIDREIENAKMGLTASITIKLNNLEEEVLIKKLYEASNAGVKVNLIIRSICRLVPGVVGQSENIIIKRIVDRFLEHGRVFIFHNNGKEEIYMGSADWMNRNIYRRIEVCFPLYDETIKNELSKIIALQWKDTAQAVLIDDNLNNVALSDKPTNLRSQEAIYRFLNDQTLLIKERNASL